MRTGEKLHWGGRELVSPNRFGSCCWGVGGSKKAGTNKTTNTGV